MIAPWNRRAVFIDFSEEDAKRVIEVLKRHDIEYYGKRGSNMRARGRGIEQGFNSDICKTPETRYTFYVYVHRNDAKRAREILEREYVSSKE